MMRAKPIPETHRSVAPYLIVESADRAIDFYKTSFGAIELVRLIDGSGKVSTPSSSLGALG
jgi:PhnB protein